MEHSLSLANGWLNEGKKSGRISIVKAVVIIKIQEYLFFAITLCWTLELALSKRRRAAS